MSQDKISDEDMVAQGSNAAFCERWPDEVNGEGHAFVSTKPAGTSLWIRRCSFCGWIDGADLESQVEALRTELSTITAGKDPRFYLAAEVVNLVESRAEARAEVEALRTELSTARRQLDLLGAGGDQLAAELSTTRQERDEAKAEIVIEKWLRQNHAAALAEVRRLHAPHQVPTSPDGYTICRTCDKGTPTEKCHMHSHVRWPCPTAAAVDALPAPEGGGT